MLTTSGREASVFYKATVMICIAYEQDGFRQIYAIAGEMDLSKAFVWFIANVCTYRIILRG